ncbi:hypothetical protein AX774_g4161 [Zancudomyces culisetae]|uniref:Uncharacterized protein n=1 Tax=Zancudomyces culisetae TaxID=1213189 RepID=A0A1R1PN10_ZANCU|nr:hypothetical protein AX774_g4161 [Zancudomyces culisetae]|eukprot:OMH82355.1 hypothetical protein AX774_g4161 [Zancudomyces culisetae]
MIKAAVLGSIILGSSLASAVNSYDVQQNENQLLDKYDLKLYLGSESSDRPKRKRRSTKLSIQLYGDIDYNSPIQNTTIIPNKCYNQDGIGSLKTGKQSKYRGVIIACTEEDCYGICQFLPRRVSNYMPKASDQLGGVKARSYSWISPYY